MQCKSDAIKMQERAWGKNPGTMPTYLFSRPCREKPKWQWQRWHWALAVRQADRGGGEGRRRGKEPTRRIESNQAAGQRGVIGPTQNQNIRSRVGQATTRQRDWQPTLNFAMKQDKMHLNGPIFHSSPIHVCSYSQGYPVCALGCLDVWILGLPSSCISSLHCSMQYAMFAFCW